MPTILNIILITLGIASLLIPIWQIIYNKKRKGIKAITNLGRLMLTISVLLLIFGIWDAVLVDKQKARENKSLRVDLSDSFNNALHKLDPNLKYDAVSNTVIISNTESQGGIVITGSIGANVIGNTVIQPGTEIPAFTAIIDTELVLNDIEKLAKQENILSKDVYILIVMNSNGARYFMDVKKMLSSRNYNVLKTLSLQEKSNGTGQLKNGMSITVYDGKIAIILSNFFP